MEREQINKIVNSLSKDHATIQIVNERMLFLNNEPMAISTLVETIHKTCGNAYTDLSANMMSQLIVETQNLYGNDIAAITLDNWEDDNAIHRLANLHEYIRFHLAGMLRKSIRQISWSVVGKIISSVFGKVPIITRGVRKVLKTAHLLQHQYTDNIHHLLLSVRELWFRYRNDIEQIMGELIIRGVFGLGVGQTPQEIAIILTPILLTRVFYIIYGN